MQLLALFIGVVCWMFTSFLIDEFPLVTILGLHFRSDFVFVPLGLLVILGGYLLLKKKPFWK
jgi:hypothetical protein